MQKFFNFLGKHKGLWRVLMVVFALIFLLGFVVGSLLEANKAQVNRYLGTTTEKVSVPEDSESFETYTPDYDSTSDLIDAHIAFGTKLSQEGTVLLKNDAAALPLVTDDTNASDVHITLYGVSSAPSGAYYGMKMGGIVDPSQSVSLYDALKDRGFDVNKDMNDYYEAKASSDENTNNIKTLYNLPTTPTPYPYYEVNPNATDFPGVTGNYARGQSGTSVGIVVIGRPSSEGGDYTPGSDGLEDTSLFSESDTGNVLSLSDYELETIAKAKSNSDKVIVLLNTTNAMELGPIIGKDSDVDAIMYIGFPGNYGMYGVADVLKGTTNPSGHLSDTYAMNSASAPSVQNFGIYEYANAFDADGNGTMKTTDGVTLTSSYNASKYVVEAEGIYVGYKYYETRYEDSVLSQGSASSSAGAFAKGATSWEYEDEVAYSFGSGLSYTTFKQEIDTTKGDEATPGMSLSADKKTVTIYYTVTNTGDVAGRSVVQVYGQSPYTEYDKENKVEKASVQLLNYAKTDVIEAGKSVPGSITIDLQYIASYDTTATNSADSTKTGQYIMEEGTYYFALADNNVESADTEESYYQEGAHAAINNILAQKAVDNSTTYTLDNTGSTAAVVSLDWSADDKNIFAKDPTTGEVVSNELDSANINTYLAKDSNQNEITYLSRSDWTWGNSWKTTWSTGQQGVTTLTATQDMIDLLVGSTYKLHTDDDVSGIKFDQKTDLTFGDMIDKDGTVQDYDSDDWNELMDALNLEEGITFIGCGNRTYYDLSGINFIGGTYTENGPSGIALNLPSAYDAPWFDADDYSKNANYSWNDMGCATLQACTFDQELLNELGVLWGNDSLFINLPVLWAPSINIHRTPYNGRSAEYYSEDPVLSGYSASQIVMGGQTKGLVCTVKHFISNDQEFCRYALSMFANEQQLREGELRGFQITFEYGKAVALMNSYSRIGCTISNASEGLMTGILRGEWQYKGYAVSDYAGTYLAWPFTECVKAGTTNFDIKEISFWETTAKDLAKSYAGDATMLQAVKDSVHEALWAFAHSNMVNYIVPGAKNVKVMNWWRSTYYAMEIVGGIVAGLALVAYVASEIVPVKKEEA